MIFLSQSSTEHLLLDIEHLQRYLELDVHSSFLFFAHFIREFVFFFVYFASFSSRQVYSGKFIEQFNFLEPEIHLRTTSSFEDYQV